MTYPWVKIENRNNFVFDIKVIHPDDPRYFPYWKEEKKRVIEGYWAFDNGGWRFMPPKLYFTVNHGSMIITDSETKYRKKSRPYLTTLFWEMGYMSLESLGFSGFKNSNVTCNPLVFELQNNWSSINSKKHINLFKENGKFKDYVPAREFMRQIHSENLGLPLYENTMKNYMLAGTRSGGKSYYMAIGEIAHEIITDGSRYYTEDSIKNPNTITTLIGSGDTGKSSELAAKILDCFTELANSELLGVYGRFGDVDYMPSPFYKDMIGDISPNNKDNPFRHEYKVRVNGRDTIQGTGSKLLHVSYSEMKAGKKGAQAGAGSRVNISVIEEMGLCFGKDTPIRMFDGSVKFIQDITQTDLIMGHDGSVRTIKQLNKGVDTLYKINQQNGLSYIVNSKHPLVLFEKYKNSNAPILIEAKDFNNIKKSKRKEIYGIKSECLNFENISFLRIDPYYLGYWLGDGYSSNTSLCFGYKEDDNVIEYFKNFAKINNINFKEKLRKTEITTTFTTPKGKENNLLKSLQFYNLINNKHIPKEYLFASKEERLNLLAGLIDSDGCLTHKGKTSQRFEIAVSKKEFFVKEIEFLARSLGYKVYTIKKISNKGFGNTVIEPRFKYRIFISGKIWEIPTKYKRKQASYIEHKKNHLHCSITVEKLDRNEYYGFELNESPYFLLEDNTVVHNTPLAREAWRSNESIVQTDGVIFGRQIGIGTSENIEAVVPMKEIFTNPKDYRVMEYEDLYEHTGNIGFFIPSDVILAEAMDTEGNIDFDKANHLLKQTEFEKAQAKNPDVLRSWKLNYPRKPTDMWLGTKAKLLPYEESALREKELMTNGLYHRIGKCIKLTWNSKSSYGVSYEIDYSKAPIFNYPIPSGSDIEGAVVIYDFPQYVHGVIPEDMYIYTHDTYIADELDKGKSLGCTHVWLNPKYFSEYLVGSPLVATYLGKAAGGKKEYYDTQEKLIALYGNCPAMLYYEANRGEDCYYHYLNKKKINLLCPRPTSSDSMFQETTRKFGFIVSNRLDKLNLISSFNDLLLTDVTKNTNNVDIKFIETIPDIYLIREIMSFNLEDNFDAISSSLGYVIAIRELEKNKKNEIIEKNSKINRLAFLSINPLMFKNNDYQKIRS